MAIGRVVRPVRRGQPIVGAVLPHAPPMRPLVALSRGTGAGGLAALPGPARTAPLPYPVAVMLFRWRQPAPGRSAACSALHSAPGAGRSLVAVVPGAAGDAYGTGGGVD